MSGYQNWFPKIIPSKFNVILFYIKIIYFQKRRPIEIEVGEKFWWKVFWQFGHLSHILAIFKFQITRLEDTNQVFSQKLS